MTQYGEPGGGAARGRGLPPVKGQDGIFLGGVGIKQGGEVGDLQDFVDDLWNLAQLQIAAGAASAGEQAHQHSQSAAVDESDFAQMEHDVAAIAQQVDDVQAQDFGFTGRDASAATDDGDLPDSARVQ